MREGEDAAAMRLDQCRDREVMHEAAQAGRIAQRVVGIWQLTRRLAQLGKPHASERGKPRDATGFQRPGGAEDPALKSLGRGFPEERRAPRLDRAAMRKAMIRPKPHILTPHFFTPRVLTPRVLAPRVLAPHVAALASFVMID